MRIKMSLIADLNEINTDVLVQILLYLPLSDLLRLRKDVRISKIMASSEFWNARIQEEFGVPKEGKEASPYKHYLGLLSEQASMQEAISIGKACPPVTDFVHLREPFRRAIAFGAALQGCILEAQELVGKSAFPSILFSAYLHKGDIDSLDMLIEIYTGPFKYRYLGYRALHEVLRLDFFTPEIVAKGADYGDGAGPILAEIIHLLPRYQSDDPIMDILHKYPDSFDAYAVLDAFDEKIAATTEEEQRKYILTRAKVRDECLRNPAIDYPQYHAKVMYEVTSEHPIAGDDLYSVVDQMYRRGGINDIHGSYHEYYDNLTCKHYITAYGAVPSADTKFKGRQEEVWGGGKNEEDYPVMLTPFRSEIVERGQPHTQFLNEPEVVREGGKKEEDYPIMLTPFQSEIVEREQSEDEE